MTTHPVAPFLEALYALPDDMPAPEVSLDNDGDIHFDWAESHRVWLSVALSESGRVVWAALISGHGFYGSSQLPDLPEQLKQVIARYAGRTESDGLMDEPPMTRQQQRDLEARSSPKLWGINRYREHPNAGGSLVVEFVVNGWTFPVRIWGTGTK